MKQAQDTYQEPQIMTFPGVIARVHRPVLDDAERERRMQRIKKTAERVLLATNHARACAGRGGGPTVTGGAQAREM